MTRYHMVVSAMSLATIASWGLAVRGDTLLVPQNYATIQAAIDKAIASDTVLVSPGTYQERVRLKAGVKLKSTGDDAPGKLGLKRAEATIIDGGGNAGEGPGVAMAEGATLDGFSITNVGQYDDAEWNKHHATQGNDQPHEHIGQPGTAGISVIGVTCTIANNIVHHIGYTGIAIQGVKDKRCSPHVFRNVCYRNMGGGIGSMQGSTAVIEENTCFQNFYAGIGHEGSSPLVIHNVCYENIRAGIGISEGARPVVRGNQCYHNRRAGIGVRTGSETSPVVEDNECYENDMAGIGCEEGATPIIRNNRCYNNKMAGIGCQDKAAPIISNNQCYENDMAGIGSRDHARPLIQGNVCRENRLAGIGVEQLAQAIIVDNKCIENLTVAIGVRNGSTAFISGNELIRSGGMPPMIAVREGSSATVTGNTIRGGGVAGVMVDGTATVANNRFDGNGPRGGGPPNFAVWVHAGSQVTMSDNHVDRWRHALFANGAKSVSASGNRIANFMGAAFVVQQSKTPANVFRNIAVSNNSVDKPVSITGPQGIVSDNKLDSTTVVPGAENNE